MPHRVQLKARAKNHYAYSGRSIVVTSLEGMVSGGPEGFFVENTRLLSRLCLHAGDSTLRAVAVSPAGGDRIVAYYEAAPAPGIPGSSVYLSVTYALERGLAVRITVDNFSLGAQACDFVLSIDLDADFADAEEAEKGARQQSGPVERSWDPATTTVSFSYRHPPLDRAARVRVTRSPAGPRFDGGLLAVPIRLGSHERSEIELAVEPMFRDEPTIEPVAAVAGARQRLNREAVRIGTSNDTVARAWRTAVADLASLPYGHPAGPSAPIAGLPLYQQFFGRDTLTVAWQAAAAMPSMLRDALTANAELVGRRIDDWSDEEPGKLIHQASQSPLAVLGMNNNRRNYGDYATAPDFLIMLGQYLLWTDDRATVRRLLPVARQVVDWIDRYADLDDDGLIEYRTRSPKGIKNQGWKDADDAIVDDRGSVIEPPIGTCELQGYVYAGLQQAAVAFAVAGGDRAFAAELLLRARRLRALVNDAFWMPDIGFYAMALDPNKRQVRSLSSNPAHLLATGVVPRSRAAQVVRRLMAPDMFSGWGIRTLSSEHPAYNPFSYHRGSVWPVENGTAALGLARYGRWDALHTLAEGLFALTELFVEGRLPEAAGGLPRDREHPHPGIYPASCEPQAWSASMVVMLVQSLAAMLPVAPLGLLLVNPHLPPWLPDLELKGLHVGDAEVDLQMWRTDSGETRFDWRSRGRARVIRQPPPQASGPLGRLRALF